MALPLMSNKEVLDRAGLHLKLHDIFDLTRMYRESMKRANRDAFRPVMSPTVKRENKQSKNEAKKSRAKSRSSLAATVKAEILGKPRKTAGCPHCSHKPEDLKCSRIVLVDKQNEQDVESLCGCAFTEAEEGDELPSLIEVRQCFIELTPADIFSQDVQVKILRPKDLPFQLRLIEPRPAVYHSKCARDITRLVDRVSGECVGL